MVRRQGWACEGRMSDPRVAAERRNSPDNTKSKSRENLFTGCLLRTQCFRAWPLQYIWAAVSLHSGYSLFAPQLESSSYNFVLFLWLRHLFPTEIFHFTPTTTAAYPKLLISLIYSSEGTTFPPTHIALCKGGYSYGFSFLTNKRIRKKKSYKE